MHRDVDVPYLSRDGFETTMRFLDGELSHRRYIAGNSLSAVLSPNFTILRGQWYRVSVDRE